LLPREPGLFSNIFIRAAQGAPLKSANDDCRGRESCYRDGGVSSKPRRAILAGLVLLLGLIFMKSAQWCLDCPAPPLGFRIAGWLGWFLGFGVVGYGTLLGLSLLHPIDPLG
jgi:hypothetical protein